MRISDWSSDVCSSDLGARPVRCVHRPRRRGAGQRPAHDRIPGAKVDRGTAMRDTMSSDRRRAMLRTAMGPTIAAALADPAVVAIMVNPDGALRLARLGAGRIDTGPRYAPAQVERINPLVPRPARTRPDSRRAGTR